jgi:hypothetical protein
MYYYIEILNDGKIQSFGSSTSVDLALQNTKGKLLEITEQQYAMVAACKGKLSRGINILDNIENKIIHYLEDIETK